MFTPSLAHTFPKSNPLEEGGGGVSPEKRKLSQGSFLAHTV